MAAWYQGPAQSLVRGGAGSRRGRHPDPRWRTVAPAPPRQGGGLARGRAPFDRRARVLPLNLPIETPLKILAATIKARWLCEQAHQQLKEELGLDHFEGRSWSGLHRHALMSMIAFLYLQNRRLEAAKRGKKQDRPAASAEPTRDTHRDHRVLQSRPLPTMSLPARNSPEQHAGNLPK